MKLLYKKFVKRLGGCESGLAATEFALLLPVLVFLFFGLVEASTALTVNRKVAIASNTLADLTAQSESLRESEVDDLFQGVFDIVEPNDTSGMTLRLISVELDDDDDPVVHWSRASDGTTPYAAGSYYTSLDDDDVISSTGSLIVVEMTYTYQPSITNHVLNTPFVFDRISIRWPRLTSKVQLCDAMDNCTT